MSNRFDFEQQLMQCWHITDDLNTVMKSVDGMKMDAKDKDTLLNMLIGLRTLYDCRFTETLDMFGDMIREGTILNPTPYV